MKVWLQSHPEARSGVRVAAYAFVGQFALALLGFLYDVQEWATSTGAAEFPAVTPLGKAVAAALSAAVIGLIAFGYNKLPFTTTARYPAEPQPDAERQPDRGAVDLVTILVVLAIIIAVVWILRNVNV